MSQKNFYQAPSVETVRLQPENALLGTSELGRLQEQPHNDFNEPFN